MTNTKEITLSKEGVFLGDGVRVAEPIKIKAIGKRQADKKTLVEIEFKTVDGECCSKSLEFSYLQPERRREIRNSTWRRGVQMAAGFPYFERNRQAAGRHRSKT